MTAKERAKKCVEEMTRKMGVLSPVAYMVIEQAIITAVNEEREACIKIAMKEADWHEAEAKRLHLNEDAANADRRACHTAVQIANEISARSEEVKR